MINIKGRKGGQSKGHTPVESPDSLQSIARAKILLALGEGEFAGGITDEDILLDGTPIATRNNSGDKVINFPGVTWDIRYGTETQPYIKGMSSILNLQSTNLAITTETPMAPISVNNPAASGVLVNLSVNSLQMQKDNGDMVGYRIEYRIEVNHDGEGFKTVLTSAFDGKTTSPYERSHRIDLPDSKAKDWSFRVVRITPNKNSVKYADSMNLTGYSPIIDAKLRYPNTAVLYVSFDAKQFNNIPQVSVKARGRKILVPDIYDPETRTYNEGVNGWSGALVLKYSNNPAWVFYDLVLNKRFGLGDRITPAMVDKWELYRIAKYCDQTVWDGLPGTKREPRFLCDVYIQDQNEAFNVLRDIASIFRGMTYYGRNQLITLADMPRDVSYVYTRANVIDGKFTYASSSERNRYTTAMVSFSNPDNHYADDLEAVAEPDLIRRYGIRQTSITAIGCTRRSEANRRGRWALLTNSKDRLVTFSTGLDGFIPMPGYVIGIADPLLTNRTLGGRVESVNGRVITCDRAPTGKAGDRLLINLPTGVAESQRIDAVVGNNITVRSPFSTAPVTGSVWTIDTDEVNLQTYRVASVMDNDDGTFTITATYYYPDKYSAIDDGARLDTKLKISDLPIGAIAAPTDVVVSSHSRVVQNISVETMRISWKPVKGATSYEVQWQKDNGDWVNAGKTSSLGTEIDGIYSGSYIARVCAINSMDVSSIWATSAPVELTGKVGMPSPPLGFRTTPILFGVQMDWDFPDASQDTLFTELQISNHADGSGAQLLADVPYPLRTYQQLGMAVVSANEFYYRARLVDKIGNNSTWTAWIKGEVESDPDLYFQNIDAKLRDSDAFKELQKGITDGTENLAQIQKDLLKNTQDLAKEMSDRKDADSQETITRTQAISDAAKAAADALAAKAGELGASIGLVQSSVDSLKSSVAEQIASLSAGGSETFDALKIWYFDTDAQGWTSKSGTPATVNNGWIHPTDEQLISPPLAADAKTYKYIKMRVRKVGTRTDAVFSLAWKEDGDTDFGHKIQFPAPNFDATGTATVDIPDIPWNQEVHQIALISSIAPTATDYLELDWIAIGRPTPGASIAALEDVRKASTDAITKEALARSTLATQLRGDYEGTDSTGLTQGLLFNERKATIDREKVISDSVTSLQTDWNDNKSKITQQLETLSADTASHATSINTLQSALQDATQDSGNILLNGSFEVGLSPWVLDPAQGSIVDTDHQHGSKGIKLISAGGNKASTLKYTQIPVRGGNTYELSFWYKVSSDFAEATTNTSNAFILSGNNIVASNKLGRITTWTNQKIRYAPTTSGSIDLQFVSNIAAGGLFIDNVTFIDVSVADAIARLDNMYLVTLDLLALDQNKWFPVTIDLNASSRDLDTDAFRFRVSRPLSVSYGTPTWGAHSTSGFSLSLDWSVLPSGYGANNPDRRIEEFQYLWTKDGQSPALTLGQMANSSNEYVYLRGGSKYDMWLRKGYVPVIHTASYTNNSQTIDVITDYTKGIIPKSTSQIAAANATATQQLTTDVKTIGDKATATAQSLTQLTSTVGAANASLTEMQKTIAEKALAQQQGFDLQRAQIGENDAAISDLTNTIATDKASYSTRLTNLETKATANAASISTMQSAWATDKASFAQQINTVKATADGAATNAALVQVKATAEAATTPAEATTIAQNAVKAVWSVKVTAAAGTAPAYVAGISLASNGTNSSFIVQADQFGVYESKAGKQMLFAVDGNGAYLNTAIIRNATIGFAKITGVNITDAHITNGAISLAKIKTADINTLKAQSLSAATAAIGTAKIAWANITGVSIQDAQIHSLNVSKLTGDVLQAVTISANGVWSTYANATVVTVPAVAWNRIAVAGSGVVVAGSYQTGTTGGSTSIQNHWGTCGIMSQYRIGNGSWTNFSGASATSSNITRFAANGYGGETVVIPANQAIQFRAAKTVGDYGGAPGSIHVLITKH